jgi:hypothetical protein
MGGGPPRAVPWSLVANLGRAAGLLLLFLGTLVAVLFASFPADCFTMTCTGSDAASVQYGILASRLLWTFGAFGLAGGAAIKLHFLLDEPGTDSPEATRRYLARRRSEFLLLLVGVAILLLLLLTAGTTISPAL